MKLVIAFSRREELLGISPPGPRRDGGSQPPEAVRARSGEKGEAAV